MSKHNFLLFIAITIATIMAIVAVSASAQSIAGNITPGALPVSLFIDNAISAHEQDIKDRMLDYEFNHTTSDAVRASIVKVRSDELNAVALDQQAFLEALNNDSSRGLIPDDRLNAMLNMTKNSITRISRSSNDLHIKIQKIKGNAASGNADPLIVNINSASALADNISKGNANKNNAGIGTQNIPPKHPDNPKSNK